MKKAEANGSAEATTTIQSCLRDQREAIAEYGAAGVQQLEQKLNAAAAASPIPIGDSVTLIRLKGKPELNGQRGVVARFDPASGRCQVKLEDGRGPFNIKPENLRK